MHYILMYSFKLGGNPQLAHKFTFVIYKQV